MIARYASTCCKCGFAIRVPSADYEGDRITKSGRSWVHEQCPSGDPVRFGMERPSLHTAALQRMIDKAPMASAAVLEAEPEVITEFIMSKYHPPIFEAIKAGGRSVAISATAGSGKTRTELEIVKQLIPPTASWIYLVFNKRNRAEAQGKFKGFSNGQVHTFHSFALAALRNAGYKFIIDDEGRKLRRAISTCMNRETERELIPTVLKIVGLVKNTMSVDIQQIVGSRNPHIGDLEIEQLLEMCDHYGVELNGGDTSRVMQAVKDVLVQDWENESLIDFDDMPWFVATKNVPVSEFDYVLVDETQDLNLPCIELVRAAQKSAADGGTVTIVVGDDNQSMYGFRGADADAFSKVIQMLGAETFPLSLSYRNSKAVGRFVNEAMPEIAHEVVEWAAEGTVGDIKQGQLYSKVQPGDMVVCRTNAPLVRPAFELIRMGVKAMIVGRSIGDEIVNLISRTAKRAGTDHLETVLATMTDYCAHEIARLMLQEKEGTAQALQDKLDTVLALADGCTMLEELTAKAKSIFSDEVAGVVFSSVHRAKGLEAERVFILRYDLMPHPMAKQGWQMKQESNCKFVALTRAKSEMWFVQEEK